MDLVGRYVYQVEAMCGFEDQEAQDAKLSNVSAALQVTLFFHTQFPKVSVPKISLSFNKFLALNFEWSLFVLRVMLTKGHCVIQCISSFMYMCKSRSVIFSALCVTDRTIFFHQRVLIILTAGYYTCHCFRCYHIFLNNLSTTVTC